MVAACPKVGGWIEADSGTSTLVQWRGQRMVVKRWGGAAGLAICLALTSPFAAAQADEKVDVDSPADATDNLAQALNNPLANLITVSIQNNFDFGGDRARSTWFRMRNMSHRTRGVWGQCA